ncbi:MAG: hypothetical protein HYV63_07020 [Candidatus Schekmanbacteria bacterium]|nr:hypothetical protein [Candidatus Schekmanbacteria bacterium]
MPATSWGRSRAVLYLEILVEDPVPTGFFDFLPPWTAIENKAPRESFGITPFIEAFGIDRTKEALRHFEAGQGNGGDAQPRKRRKK